MSRAKCLYPRAILHELVFNNWRRKISSVVPSLSTAHVTISQAYTCISFKVQCSVLHHTTSWKPGSHLRRRMRWLINTGIAVDSLCGKHNVTVSQITPSTPHSLFPRTRLHMGMATAWFCALLSMSTDIVMNSSSSIEEKATCFSSWSV